MQAKSIVTPEELNALIEQTYKIENDFNELKPVATWVTLIIVDFTIRPLEMFLNLFVLLFQ